ncbi:MAG: sigma-70 family RNA polymerase sigma factor [Proteobacteria bacterium]|nr:sigma-70 family RNA polymerase sigma factor [Pseudomonadota bacterium]
MAHDLLTKRDWIYEALERFERPLLRHALRITGDIEVARDVVQDTFLKLCKADQAQIEGHLAAWLFTVCRNRALDIQKKERRMGRLEDVSAIADSRAGPGDMAAKSEALNLISEVLESLSEQQRDAFRLKFEDQLTYREIGQVMGKSLGTVSKLITTALLAVRGRMKACEKLAGESVR